MLIKSFRDIAWLTYIIKIKRRLFFLCAWKQSRNTINYFFIWFDTGEEILIKRCPPRFIKFNDEFKQSNQFCFFLTD